MLEKGSCFLKLDLNNLATSVDLFLKKICGENTKITRP